jgi:hypothetical protein
MTGEIKIEKGVPISFPKMGRPTKYPWADMAPGDSFFVPVDSGNIELRRQCLRRCATAQKIKIATRKENGGLRIWRIE